MIWHVHPVNDLKPHKLEFDCGCDCDPRVQVLKNGDMLVTHNSFDKRELTEFDHHSINIDHGSNSIN